MPPATVSGPSNDTTRARTSWRVAVRMERELSWVSTFLLRDVGSTARRPAEKALRGSDEERRRAGLERESEALPGRPLAGGLAPDRRTAAGTSDPGSPGEAGRCVLLDLAHPVPDRAPDEREHHRQHGEHPQGIGVKPGRQQRPATLRHPL